MSYKALLKKQLEYFEMIDDSVKWRLTGNPIWEILPHAATGRIWMPKSIRPHVTWVCHLQSYHSSPTAMRTRFYFDGVYEGNLMEGLKKLNQFCLHCDFKLMTLQRKLYKSLHSEVPGGVTHMDFSNSFKVMG